MLFGPKLNTHSSEEPLIQPVQVLVVSYSFPPQGEVGGIRVSQFCKYLPQNGIIPTVLTSTIDSYEFTDQTIPIPSGIDIVRASMHRTPLDLYRRVSDLRRKLMKQPTGQSGIGTETASKVSSGASSESRFRLHLETFLQTPDRYWGWYFKAVSAADAVMSSRKIDLIFSSGPPFICHLIARKLRRKYGIPWIADFRDPWASNEIATKQPAWRQAMDRRWEASCVHDSSLVVCNTDRLRERFAQHYTQAQSQKFVSLTNGFMEVPPSPSRSSSTDQVWLHTGELYSSRRIDGFCTALEQLSQERRLDTNALHVDFYGGIEPRLYSAAKQATPRLFDEGVLRFKSRIPWAESQKLMRTARLLLLFQGTFHAQTPAKVYEYLATGIPIFAIAKKGSLTDLIEMTGSGLWADPEDLEDIKTKLMLSLALPIRQPEEVISRLPGLHYSSLTRKLASWMREKAGKSGTTSNDSVHAQSMQLS